MAQDNNTPVPFWLSLTLMELTQWIHDHNQIVKEKRQKRQKR